jgi:uncharacterized membrane protein YoaK (UPF0700 family)
MFSLSNPAVTYMLYCLQQRVCVEATNAVPSMAESQVQHDRLISAAVLAATGGLLDAVVYTLHGHVFANAMTGNVILLGISAFSQDWLQAMRHLVPICCFIAGVVASRYLRILPQFYASIAVLALEMLVLFAAGLLSLSFPEMAFTAIIAFTSAFQVSTFRQVGRFAYNSTFITGNLRTASEALVNQFLERESELRHSEAAKARKLFLICGFFLVGAIAGAAGAPHLGNQTLWLAEPLLLVALGRVLYLKTDAGIPSPE